MTIAQICLWRIDQILLFEVYKTIDTFRQKYITESPHQLFFSQNYLNHSTINYFPPTSNLLDYLPTHFQSKPIHTSIPISTLQIANDHKLVTNSTIINTISDIDSKHSTKKSSTFPRNILSSPSLQHIPNILLTAKKTNHLKASPITKYYQSSVPKLHHDKQIPLTPTE